MPGFHLRARAPGDPQGVAAGAIDASGAVFAWLCDQNPLDAESAHALESLAASGAGRLVAWSGSMGQSLFERSPLTWMPAGRAAFDGSCARLRDIAGRAGAPILLRPHARHVLSDAPTCRRWVDSWRSERMGLLFDPASMFEAGMLPDAPDHLPRLFEALGPVCDALLLACAQAGAGDDAPVRLTTLGAGDLDAAQLAALTRQWIPANTPVITLTPACQRALVAP